MKNKRIDLRASETDEIALQKASTKLGTSKVSETIFSSVQAVANAPVEYFADREAIREADQNINYGLFYLTAFQDEFFNVTGQYLTLAELETTFEAVHKLNSSSIIEGAIRESVTQKLYAKLKQEHPDFTFDVSNIPLKDLTTLFEAAGKVNDIPYVRMRSVGIYWSCYQIEEGKIIVIPEKVEQIKNNYRSFASGPDQVKRLEKIKRLCEVLNELMSEKDIEPSDFNSGMVTYYDNELGRFVPNGGYVSFPLKRVLFTR